MDTLSAQRDPISYNSVMKACQKGQWQSAMTIFDHVRFETVHPTVRTYCSSIAAAAFAQRWLMALAMWQHPICKSSPVCGNALVSASSWTGALEILQMLQTGLQVTLVTFGAAIAACGKRWQMALCLREDMSQARLEVNIISCNSVMNSCAEESQWEMAIQLLAQIRKDKLLPTVVSQNTLLLALANGNEWQTALDVLKQMLEKDESSYNTVIDALAQVGQWERSLCILQVMLEETVRPNRISFNSAVNACANDGSWLMALALLERMEKEQLELNAIGLSSAVTACSRGRQWAMALDILHAVQAQQALPDTMSCNSAIKACGGQWWRIFDLLCCMPFPDLITYSTPALVKEGEDLGIAWRTV
eukprot:symbB.v1.2.013570.t1/scaffold963.1/size148485/10